MESYKLDLHNCRIIHRCDNSANQIGKTKQRGFLAFHAVMRTIFAAKRSELVAFSHAALPKSNAMGLKSLVHTSSNES